MPRFRFLLLVVMGLAGASPAPHRPLPANPHVPVLPPRLLNYSRPVAYRDDRFLLGYIAVVSAPSDAHHPALIRKVGPNGDILTPIQIPPGTQITVTMYTHHLEYTLDGRNWLRLEVE